MSARHFDALAKSMATSGSRRRFMAAVGAGLLTTFSSRQSGTAQGNDCVIATDCDPGFVCDNGFCILPACTGQSGACSSHNECCDDLLCFDGICATGPTCGIEYAGCSTDADCCPGLICPAGICEIFVPPPDPTAIPTTVPTTPPSSGGSGGSDTGSSGNAGSGTSAPSGANGGVVVSSLPKTGNSTAQNDPMGPKTGMLAAAIAACGAVWLRVRRQPGPESTDNETS